MTSGSLSGHRKVIFFCLGLCGLLNGCRESKSYDLAPVSGIVTLDGQPLAGAIVNFQPIATGDDVSVGPGSTARCNEKGQFVLVTTHGQKGAVVGEHKIRIYSRKNETDLSSDEDAAPVVERVPEAFNYKSQVRFVVPPAGSDSADFAIVTK